MQTTATNHPVLNPAQLHLLKVFSFANGEQGLKELRSVLFDYYRKRLKEQTDEFWVNNNLNSANMEEIMYGHNRSAKK